MVSRFSLVSLVALFTLSLLSLPAFAKPDAKKDAQQAVQSGYDAQDAAIVNKDIDGSLAPYVADAVFISLAGTRSQGLDGPRQGIETLFQIPDATLSANHKIKQFSTDKTGKEATVLVVHHVDLSATSSSGEPFVMEIDEVLKHFWVKDQNGWHIKQERLVSVDSTRNGKPFRHNGKPVAAQP